jgi:hypothetical protein
MDTQVGVIHKCLNDVAEHFDTVAAEVLRQTAAALAKDGYEITPEDGEMIVVAAHVTFAHLLETLTLSLKFDL